MKSLYISGYNAKLEAEKIYLPDLYRILANLTAGYDRVVVNVSSNLELRILNFLKEKLNRDPKKQKVLSSEEVEVKFSEVEYNNSLNSLNLIMANSPELKSDILMSTKFMSAGSDILLLDDKSNDAILKYALAYAKELGVHSYAIELDELRLIG